MAKPYIHAVSSAAKFGGVPEDYLEIHTFLDSSKGVVPDPRHRALTHNTWFLSVVLERVFGVTITNSAGQVVSVRDIGEQHVLEDYRDRFIPTAQDFLEHLEFQDWMLNGATGLPRSRESLHSTTPAPVHASSGWEPPLPPVPTEQVLRTLWPDTSMTVD